uniref:Uncharacterized protein n=1 Tax=Glossina palpalis gambiensis TaxID=67801 RepID=A0A1B0BC85_9MUSC
MQISIEITTPGITAAVIAALVSQSIQQTAKLSSYHRPLSTRLWYRYLDLLDYRCDVCVRSLPLTAGKGDLLRIWDGNLTDLERFTGTMVRGLGTGCACETALSAVDLKLSLSQFELCKDSVLGMRRYTK